MTRVLSVVLVLLATLIVARADDVARITPWAQCKAAPTRACMFDEALRIAMARPVRHRAQAVSDVLFAYAHLDPQAALAQVPAAEAFRATLPANDRESVDVAILRIYTQAHKFDEAKAVLARLKGAFHYDGFAGELATAIAHGRSVVEAIALLRALGVAPSATGEFLRDAAVVAVERGEDAALMALAQEADRSGRLEPEAPFHSWEMRASIGTSATLIVALAQLRGGKIDAALSAARSVPRYAARVATLGSLGRVLVDAGRVDDALALVLQIEDAVERRAVLRWMVAPRSLDTRLPGLSAPAPSIARAASLTFGGAERFAVSLPPEDGRDYANALVARASAASGRLSDAWNVAGRIETPWAYYHALIAIGAAQARAGDVRASLETFAQAGVALRADGAADRLLFDLADLHTSLQQFDATTALLRDAAGGPTTVLQIWAARSAMMLALARLGRVEAALKLVPDVGEFRPGEARLTIATALAEGGFMREALKVTSDTAEDPMIERDGFLMGLLKLRAQAGAIDDANMALAHLRSRGARAGALMEIAAAHTKAGDGAKAVALVREAFTLISLAEQTYDGGVSTLISAGEALPP
jgi:hypothetical protein